MYACFRDGFISAVDIGLRLRKTMVRRSRGGDSIPARVVDRLNVDLGTRFWQYGLQSDRSAMRIAFSPNLRIAAGLLLAALLSIVGYRVFRRWISQGPEALLKRADDLSWLVAAAQTKPLNLSEEQKLHRLSLAPRAKATSVSSRPVIGDSISRARLDSIVDLLLTPDLLWHLSILSRRPVSSQ